LPSIDEVTALAIDLDARLTNDPEVGRAALRRWLHDGVIRVNQSPDGPIAETEPLPRAPRKPRANPQAPENSKSLERTASPGISSC
jgi:hypothetical protein